MKHTARRLVVAIDENTFRTSPVVGVEGQKKLAAKAAKAVLPLIEDGYSLVISYGNDMHIGNAFLGDHFSSDDTHTHLDTGNAMSQGAIGYWLQQALHNELAQKDFHHHSIATVITQTQVDLRDPAFTDPHHAVGPAYANEGSAKRAATKGNFKVNQDSTGAWRRVVASPKPVAILEKKLITKLLGLGIITIASGGGVPVVRQGKKIIGIEAVANQDYTTALLANEIEADALLYLTADPEIRVGTARQKQLTCAEAADYAANHSHSLNSKLLAGLSFIGTSHFRQVVIASPHNAVAALEGEADTSIQNYA